MYLISTGRTTVLSDFVDLTTNSTYQHTNGETTDFQFYQKRRIFVEVNKKSGLEILRIKEKPTQRLEIQRVRKLNIDNVYCVACARQSLENMALGLSNGQVRLYNYKNTDLVHRFKAENSRNSVLYLDYNASDEYLASVFENGQINIYGIKTKTKIDNINIDGNSTLARFHPVKRFQLTIASYKGCVTLYDVQSKRKLFNSVDAHLAPCQDVTFCASLPDTLISVGYDCIINIFDTRRKTQPVRLSNSHPLSTAAISDCGTYFCVGNLKGELISYDMRNTSMCIASKKVHDCAVTRVAFVPTESDTTSNSTSFCSSLGNHSISSSNNSLELLPTAGVGELPKAIPSNITQGEVTTSSRPRDSFCDFLDFQANKCIDKVSARLTARRDSFDWDSLTRKVSHEHTTRVSFAPMNSVPNSNKNGNDSDNVFIENTAGLTIDPIRIDFVNTKVRHKAIKEIKIPDEQERSPMTPLRESSKNLRVVNAQFSGSLVQIEEEPTQSNQQNKDDSSSDKENSHNELDLQNRLRILHTDHNSTPNHTRHSLESYIPPTHSKTQQRPITNAPNPQIDIQQQIVDLRTEMNARFQQLEDEIKFNAETNKWQIFTQASNLWNQQIDSTEEIRDALGILLQSDPFVNEFLNLKRENEILKEQLNKLLQKQ